MLTTARLYWRRAASSTIVFYLRRSSRSFSVVLTFLFCFLSLRYTVSSSSPRSNLQRSFPTWLGGVGDAYSAAGSSRYYFHETASVLPPLKHKRNGDLTAADLCEGFPRHLLDSIQIIIKTGVADVARNEAHLATLSSCISNLIVFSDVEEQVGEHHFIDVLADLPPSYTVDNPDFNRYAQQKTEYAKDGKVGKSKDGWKLDRFKFLPMVDRAYEMRPNAKWYVFLETDVYMFWDTLFRLLAQLDPMKPHYMGSQVGGSRGRWFAYGGSGFVISQGLMTRLLGDGTRLSTTFEQMVKDDCCGDAVLAYAIVAKTGVRLEGLYPTFSGDELAAISVDEARWCVPLMSLHRASPEQMKALWRWERTRPYDESTFTYSKLLGHTLAELKNDDTREHWDNLSDRKQSWWSSSHKSASACRAACFEHERCLQYSYIAGTCRFGHNVQQGRPKNKDEMFTSGWNLKKMEQFGLNVNQMNETGCEVTTWVRPLIR